MAIVVIYDPGHANERVLKKIPSVNTPDYEARVGVDVVIYLNEAAMPTLLEPELYWRHDTGAIRDMDAGEKAALDAEIAAQELAAKRTNGQALMTAPGGVGVGKRAIAEMTIREINLLRGWLEDFKAEVAAATNLADLQTRVAGLSSMPDRTLAQAKTVYHNLIDEGAAD